MTQTCPWRYEEYSPILYALVEFSRALVENRTHHICNDNLRNVVDSFHNSLDLYRVPKTTERPVSHNQRNHVATLYLYVLATVCALRSCLYYMKSRHQLPYTDWAYAPCSE